MSIKTNKNQSISIVIPAKNEAKALKLFLPRLKATFPDAEIIVVNDGSDDESREVIDSQNIVHVKHPYSKGNGAAIKSGARRATNDLILFMDGDGQHQPEDAVKLIKQFDKGFDMVVGARKTLKDQANVYRGLANKIYNWLASYMVGHNVEDLTSGMRLVERSKFISVLNLLPNGFSYPTTSTMAFFRSGYSVGYVPIDVGKRIGNSHIKLMKDGARFLLIIFKIATLYSPLKLFVPLSIFVFFLGMLRYAFTFAINGTFTNMSATLLVSSMLIFLVGLVSEQVASLMYMNLNNKNEEP